MFISHGIVVICKINRDRLKLRRDHGLGYIGFRGSFLSSRI